MKKIFSFVFLLCFVSLFASQGEKRDGFYLKIFGGPNFASGGDFNGMIDTNSKYLKNEAKQFSGKYDISLRKSPFFYGFGGEIGYDFGRFSIGLETNYSLKNFKMNRNWNDGYAGRWHCTLSAIPVLLNIHYEAVNYKSIKTYIFGGGGIFFGKYEENWNFRSTTNTDILYIGTEKSTQNNFGFQGGISINFDFSDNLSLFAQARYQFIDFSSMKGIGHTYNSGTSTYLPSGPSDYNEGELVHITYSEFTRLFVGHYNPHVHNLRRAKLNINGVSLILGIKYVFSSTRR